MFPFRRAAVRRTRHGRHSRNQLTRPGRDPSIVQLLDRGFESLVVLMKREDRQIDLAVARSPVPLFHLLHVIPEQAEPIFRSHSLCESSRKSGQLAVDKAQPF